MASEPGLCVDVLYSLEIRQETDLLDPDEGKEPRMPESYVALDDKLG